MYVPLTLRLALAALLVAGPGLFAPAVRPTRAAHPAAVPGAPTQRPVLAPPAVTDPRFGIVEALHAPIEAKEIGARWERMTLWWKDLQPDGPNSWNAFATDHDRQIDSELAAGRQVVGLLINTPAWAAVSRGSTVPKGLYLPYDDPNNYWGHFVSLTAKRYAGRIDDWVIWNEVNIPSGQWHTWTGSHADFAQLVRVAYQAAKQANPNARIILPGDPYWYDHGAWFEDMMNRLTHFPDAAANNGYFDAANLHLYDGTKHIAPIIGLYRQLMERVGLHKPIWVSETNAIPYNDPQRRYAKSNFFGTLDDQASFIVEAFATYLALGVERIEVNRMIDGTDFKAGGEPFGLVRNDHTVRPGFYAYRTASDLFSGVADGSIAGSEGSPTYVVTLHKPHATITVAWAQTNAAATIRVPVLGISALIYDKLGHARAAHAEGGTYALHVAPATDTSDPRDPKDYVIGGSPLILVQPT